MFELFFACSIVLRSGIGFVFELMLYWQSRAVVGAIVKVGLQKIGVTGDKTRAQTRCARALRQTIKNQAAREILNPELVEDYYLDYIKYIDDKIEAYQQQLEQEDAADKQEEINQKIEYQNTKKSTYQDIEKQLEQSGQTQISLTDPDARSVVLHRNIINVGYCVQAGCDSKHKLFVNNDTGTVNDTHALSPMALDVKNMLDLETMKVLTDKGYTTGKHIDICTKNNITTFSSPKAHSSQKNGLFDMQIFQYNKEEDTYTCPANQLLKTNGTIYNKNKHKVKHYKNRHHLFLL